MQSLLLEFGIVSRLSSRATGEWKVYLGNRRDARLFADRVGFWGRKQIKLRAVLAGIPETSTAMSTDHVPLIADYLRESGATTYADRDWLRRHNVDRIERWERDADEIWSHVTDPEVRAVVEPLVSGQHYYAEVASVEAAGVQPVYSFRVDSEDHAFLSDGFVSHNTECRLAPLAMEMLREIDQETVDFTPNYDGRSQEPTILPSRIPNLLVNGSSGIAVGMATNIPPHNLREVASGVQWYLENPEATSEELLDALLARVQGPDFPTGGLIVGRSGIEEAYRTGRGSVRMRAVVEVDEDAKGRTILVVSELPYQVNPDNLAESIADLVRDGKIGGIADVRDEGSQRLGQRLVIVLKRDAVAKVVLNNLYKHTQLQYTFGCNMLAIVDGVPRTLRLDQFVEYYVAHQVDVIVRRTRFQLRKAEERAHILRALRQGAGPPRRRHRPHPRQRQRRGRPQRADGPARHRRAAGRRDPGHAAAPARRARAPADPGRAGRARARDRRPAGDPGRPGPPAADHRRGARGDRRAVRRRAPHAHHRRSRAT